jgi:hypothetical protein
MMSPVFRLAVFFVLITSVFAAGTLDALVIAAPGFALAIQQQLVAVQSITTPAELAEKTISYAAAKTAYYEALRAAAPELIGYRHWEEAATARSGSIRPIVWTCRGKAGKGGGRSNCGLIGKASARFRHSEGEGRIRPSAIG